VATLETRLCRCGSSSERRRRDGSDPRATACFTNLDAVTAEHPESSTTGRLRGWHAFGVIGAGDEFRRTTFSLGKGVTQLRMDHLGGSSRRHFPGTCLHRDRPDERARTPPEGVVTEHHGSVRCHGDACAQDDLVPPDR
jgi:hypothetical protein